MSRQNNITEESAAAHYLMASRMLTQVTLGKRFTIAERLAIAQLHATLALYERLDLMHDTVGALG